MAESPRRAVVAGLGPGLGVELCAQLANCGFDVVALSRSSRTVAAAEAAVAASQRRLFAIECDLADPQAIVGALSAHRASVDVLVHCVNDLATGYLESLSVDRFEQCWRTLCLSAFSLAQLLLPEMASRGRGTALFLGATASLRGGARFPAFASARFAVRGLAQSLAREFGPRCVHVAHLILDGVIDEPQSDSRFGPATTQRMAPADIAAACLQLIAQSPTAWTQELDLRPCSEVY